MPVDRFLHPRLGHSEKVSGLTDLEFRVWAQFILSADDFGVLPMSVAKLQGDNRALDRQPRDAVEAALAKLVAVGLVDKFEHQGAPFMCQLTWSTFQKVRYPRSTHWPCPPPEVLERLDDATLLLFRNSHEKFPKDFRKIPRLPRVRGRETATGIRLPAKGNGEEAATPGRRLQGLWNTVTTAPLPRCSLVTRKREHRASVCLQERPIEEWRGVFERIERSSFCRGESDRGWLADFDWATKPDTALKVMEGKYDRANGTPRPSGRTGTPPPGKYSATVEG